MGHYILSFTVYTLAMSGLIFFALFIYKKVMNGSISSKNSKILSVEETMSISPRKTLMIIKAGEERFLIASDIDKTTLISKLQDNEKISDEISQEKIEHFKDIETQPIDLSIEIPQTQPVEEKEIAQIEETKPVHLEVVKDKNLKLSEVKKTQPRRKSKTVSIEVTDKRNHGLSTIKEIAPKVNEM